MPEVLAMTRVPLPLTAAAVARIEVTPGWLCARRALRLRWRIAAGLRALTRALDA